MFENCSRAVCCFWPIGQTGPPPPPNPAVWLDIGWRVNNDTILSFFSRAPSCGQWLKQASSSALWEFNFVHPFIWCKLMAVSWNHKSIPLDYCHNWDGLNKHKGGNNISPRWSPFPWSLFWSCSSLLWLLFGASAFVKASAEDDTCPLLSSSRTNTLDFWYVTVWKYVSCQHLCFLLVWADTVTEELQCEDYLRILHLFRSK